MVNRMSSAFRLTPQGSRSTPPPQPLPQTTNIDGQNDDCGQTSLLNAHLDNSNQPSTSSTNNLFAQTFGSADLATTMAVADGIANGIVGNGNNGTKMVERMDCLPNRTTKSAIKLKPPIPPKTTTTIQMAPMKMEMDNKNEVFWMEFQIYLLLNVNESNVVLLSLFKANLCFVFLSKGWEF